ncbi:hypothetical protein EZI54_07090 [Marinobacter halodurans]|uniref:Zinc ribbon domain-containing protein n=1 Tax=Marinobacter halodurans TaxID=2528979 RepID=A0ABY1ZR12_9GAMM|nr:hypothetical protein [Marinobacter halodurans]TBW57416.1 hypothetical protein EZI54_07090 [Marinobacter halodurans]
MSDDKKVPHFSDDLMTEGSPELTRVLNMARGGQQSEVDTMKDQDLNDLVRSGRKYGVTATSTEPEVAAYPVTVWKIECPKCGDELTAEEDECKSGASFTAECSSCGHTFPARAV